MIYKVSSQFNKQSRTICPGRQYNAKCQLLALNCETLCYSMSSPIYNFVLKIRNNDWEKKLYIFRLKKIHESFFIVALKENSELT